jgi:membrane glycosyltransferase
MMRTSMVIFYLAMLLLRQFQHAEGLALVPRSARTALLSPFIPAPVPQTTAMMAAHSEPVHETAHASDRKSDLMIDTKGFNGDVAMAAYRSEMLDLVYERSMQRLLD